MEQLAQEENELLVGLIGLRAKVEQARVVLQLELAGQHHVRPYSVH